MASLGSINLCSRSSPPSGHKLFTSSTSHITSCANNNPSELSLSAKTQAISDIKSSGVIACLRAPSTQLALEAARAALCGGISALEIVASPGVFEVISKLVREFPNGTIGVGTVLNAHDAKRAIEAGAKFLMSPVMINDVFDDVHGDGVLYIPGAMTPTEIFSAHNAGAEMVKVYPVSALGGVQYIGALKKPFPHIQMIASQGITIDSISDYIAQGACGVVLSDAIFDKKALSKMDFKAISQLATQAALLGSQAVRRSRPKNSG